MNTVISYVKLELQNLATANTISDGDGSLPKFMVKGLQNVLNHMKMDVQLAGAKLTMTGQLLVLSMDNTGKPLPDVIIIDGRG